MATTQIDQAVAEAFAGRALQVLNDGMLTLLISLGHRSGLLDVMARTGPATSDQIAGTSGLDERYVREWLAGMTVGGIVAHDPATRTFRLPPEHAACLTRAAGPDNLASLAQYVPMFGELEGRVLKCFEAGGGVPYSAMPRFQALQAEESAQVHEATLIETVLPLVDGLVERLRSGIDVLDIGCGHGHAANLIGDAFPATRVTGLDSSEAGIAAARAEAERLRLGNVSFHARDALPLAPGSCDLVTAFDVIHDLPAPSETVAAIRAALRPGGTFLMVDVAASSHLHENLDHPLGPALYTASIFHCMTVSLASGGPGLGTMWGQEQALEILAAAGFGNVEVKRLEADALNAYYVASVPVAGGRAAA